MKDKLCVPVAIQLRVDDVAWHFGDDERYKDHPSRSGIPRMHQPMDYRALHELGKALNMKVNCSLVIGEWDKDNLLRGVPHVTWDPEGWDRASEIDMAYAKACFEALEGSEYLDYNLHGLLHGYYDKGKLITESQYYPCAYDSEKQCYTRKNVFLSKDEFRRHLELFYAIYDAWGFKKKIVCFASPCGARFTPEENADYVDVLKEFGMLYWHNGWRDWPRDRKYNRTAVVNGMIINRTCGNLPWDAYDADPQYIPIRSDLTPDLCYHWTNFIRWNPENDLERVPAWADYFRRQAEVWGIMLGRNVAFSDSQGVYSQYAELTETEDQVVIDLEKVDAAGAIALHNDFCVSVRNGVEPVVIEGGTPELFETKKEFRTYRITRTGGSRVVIRCRAD